eukprot:tig00000025_g7936.t1
MGKGQKASRVKEDALAKKEEALDQKLAIDAKSKAIKKEERKQHAEPKDEAEKELGMSWFTALSTYWGFGTIVAFGHVRDILQRITGRKKKDSSTPPGFTPLLSDFDDFYTRRLYRRVHDCFNRPIASAAGAHIQIMKRKFADEGESIKVSKETVSCLNLGSYNYLGFAEVSPRVKEEVIESLQKYSASTCSANMQAGHTEIHERMEKLVARFVGKPSALVLGMGFATNSTVIPALISKGGLILSDALNHTSIVTGARLSGAKVRIFNHNDAGHLEQCLRESIASGQPRTHRPWTKILVIVEGIYSMEGEICKLKEIAAVCKKYKAYLYLDEAHSIGALGAHGRGVCEHLGVDTADVDIMMGTFTKSFGAAGGYIAGSPELIEHLKRTCPGYLYASSMSPPVCQQIITAITILLGEDGTDLGATKLAKLRENANFFRRGLKEMGCEVYGDEDSPVIPVMLYNPSKISSFSRLCLERNLAVVVVGFPATPILKSRVRFCISAAHELKDLEAALVQLEEIAYLIGIRYAKSIFG